MTLEAIELGAVDFIAKPGGMGLVMYAAEDVLSAKQAGRLGATSLVIDKALSCTQCFW